VVSLLPQTYSVKLTTLDVTFSVFCYLFFVLRLALLSAPNGWADLHGLLDFLDSSPSQVFNFTADQFSLAGLGEAFNLP